MRSGTRLFWRVLKVRTQNQLAVLRTEIGYVDDYLDCLGVRIRWTCQAVLGWLANQEADGQYRAKH